MVLGNQVYFLFTLVPCFTFCIFIICKNYLLIRKKKKHHLQAKIPTCTGVWHGHNMGSNCVCLSNYNNVLYIWNLFITEAIIWNILKWVFVLFYTTRVLSGRKTYWMKFLVLPRFILLRNNEKKMLFQALKKKGLLISALKCINKKANNRNNFKIPILGSLSKIRYVI